MFPPGIEDAALKGAGGLGGGALLLAILWKIWLRLRGDTRQDRAEGAAEHAHAVSVATLEKTIERLDGLVTALAHRLDVMGKQLDDEREAHRQARHQARDAEQTVAVLRARIEALEREIRELKLQRGAS